MKRVLVPLDGSRFAETILPDARRAAGPDGELILIRDVDWVGFQPGADPTMQEYRHRRATGEVQHYLQQLAWALRRDGVRVSTHCETGPEIAEAIDAAARCFEADLVACATHGRGPLGRFLNGGVAWRSLANSPVPILLRHIRRVEGRGLRAEPVQRRILVPLDGSALAGAALPLAAGFASEWNASIYLVRVISDYAPRSVSSRRPEALPSDIDGDLSTVRAYLEQITQAMPAEPQIRVLRGSSVVGQLVNFVEESAITDVVMTSHGRTGLQRIVLGSVADELIHRLTCPIVVVPARIAVPGQAARRTPAEAR